VILPTKHLPADKALLSIGGRVLELLLEEPRSISELWDSVRAGSETTVTQRRTSYDWFILAIDLLFLIGAVQYERGRLMRVP